MDFASIGAIAGAFGNGSLLWSRRTTPKTGNSAATGGTEGTAGADPFDGSPPTTSGRLRTRTSDRRGAGTMLSWPCPKLPTGRASVAAGERLPSAPVIVSPSRMLPAPVRFGDNLVVGVARVLKGVSARVLAGGSAIGECDRTAGPPVLAPCVSTACRVSVDDFEATSAWSALVPTDLWGAPVPSAPVEAEELEECPDADIAEGEGASPELSDCAGSADATPVPAPITVPRPIATSNPPTYPTNRGASTGPPLTVARMSRQRSRQLHASNLP